MKNKGFTLIELLIVITIIGVLAVALLPRIVGIPAKGRDAARISSMNQIVTALQSYYSENGAYPSTAGCLTATDEPGKSIISFLGQTMPKDPTPGRKILTTCSSSQFYYKPLKSGGSDNQGYLLLANTEVVGDGDNYAKFDAADLKSLDETKDALPTASKADDVNANFYAIKR